MISSRLSFFYLALCSLPLLTCSIPVSYRIPRGSKECLYDKVVEGEYITLSVVVLDGDVLKVTASLYGPFASMGDSVSEVYRKSKERHSNGNRYINNFHEISYEDLYDQDDMVDDDAIMHDDDLHFQDDMDDATFRDYYYHFDDDDDEFEFMEDDGMTAQEIQDVREAKKKHESMSQEEKDQIKKKRREERREEVEQVMKERKAQKEKRDITRRTGKNAHKRAMTDDERNTENMRDGQAFEKTQKAVASGWHMLCVQGTIGMVVVEMEMRKSTDVGAPNQNTGHLQTYERYDMVRREKKLFEGMRGEKEAAAKVNSTAIDPNAVQEEDLEISREQIQRLNRLLNEIRDKQQGEKHRLMIHAAINEHSHSRMVLSSLFETIFYIIVSGYQVYTIRNWFKGNPILGY